MRLLGVVAGIVATSVAFWLLFFIVGLPLFPNLHPEGAIPTGFAWWVHVAVATTPPLVSLLLTFFLGGLAAGGAASASPGPNGVVGAALIAFGGFSVVRSATGALDMGTHKQSWRDLHGFR